MNLYFWVFSLYALMITPLNAFVCVRIGRDVRYRVRLRIAGIPLWRKGWKAQQENRVDSERLAEGIIRLDRKLIWRLIRTGEARIALGAIRLERATVHAKLSMHNAAATALLFAGIRTLLQTAALCSPRPFVLNGHLEADFRAEGTEMMLECMISARLGNLLAAGARLWLAAVNARADLTLAEEENNAAASH